MLKLVIPGKECFDDEQNLFFTQDDLVLEMEHSLVSLSKWEAKFEKPFLSNGGTNDKTPEEILGYLEAMILTPDYPENWYERLTEENVKQVNEYIEAKVSGTWFNEGGSQTKSTSETITSELIYYWMDAYGIDTSRENWHLTRLFNLIKIHSLKNTKPKPMSKSEQAAQQRKLNAERRSKMSSAG